MRGRDLLVGDVLVNLGSYPFGKFYRLDKSLSVLNIHCHTLVIRTGEPNLKTTEPGDNGKQYLVGWF